MTTDETTLTPPADGEGATVESLPSDEDSLRGKLGFLARKLERIEEVLAPKQDSASMSPEQRIAELEQRTWKAEALARHGLAPEDAMFLHGSEQDIHEQAARLAEKTRGTRSGAAAGGASPALPPLPIPPSASRPRSRAEQAEQQLKEFVRQNQQTKGMTF